MQTNLWSDLVGLMPVGRYIKGNVIAENADGSYSVATSDGATIRARPLPGQTWNTAAGVLVHNGCLIDNAPSLPGITQYA